MKYKKIVKGKFIDRPNRFVADVEVDNRVEKVHVKNTGRCKELLIPRATVFLEDFQGRMGSRKMRYSLVGVLKGDLMINMDSQAPNKVALEALETGIINLKDFDKLTYIKPEKTFGNSRIDFYVEDAAGHKGFIEVKGVTLEDNGAARFPDAPTLRGLKHVHELINATEVGYFAAILFVVQMNGMKSFQPNWDTQPDFGYALRKAQERGVELLAYQCQVTDDSLSIAEQIPVFL